jgi:hypothetical protein
MPIKLPPKRGLPERIKRHVALRELAREQAVIHDGKVLKRREANAAARELAKQPLPHTKHYWDTEIAPEHEP